MNGIGVTIPYTNFPINIVGAGIGVTVLRETVNSGNSTMFARLWNGQNYSGAPIRILGISFVGFVENESVTHNNGISIHCTQDFRIHHCSFQDFASSGIYTDNNTGGTYKLINRGVIDHCDFDNPYKDNWAPYNPSNPTWAVWGYGIIVVGSSGGWVPDITSLLGKYETIDPNSVSHPVFIEDCTFTRCRHSIAANTNGFYVSRHNHFQKSSPYDHNDGHGGNPGTRLIESYDNIFDLTDESYSYGQDGAVLLRGGDAVMFNNTIRVSYDSTTCLKLVAEATSPYGVAKTYAWNNTTLDVNGNQIPIRVNNYSPDVIQENVNYFLRAPNQAQDGFTYTPYVYPHPLVSGVTPPPTGPVTPYAQSLAEGNYKITMPTQIQVGSDPYNFKQWEDGSTNPIRTITLNQNIAITATYELYTPPPTTITLSIIAGANGSVFPTDTVTMVIGQPYQFQATPNSGYNFDHWDLDGLSKGSSNPLLLTATIDMNGKTLTALFTLIPPTPVTINIAVRGNGTTDLTPGSHEFHVGDTVTIIAIPVAGNTFKGWTLNGTRYTENPLNLPITADMAGKTLTAEFSSPAPITSSMLLPALGLLAVVGIGYLATRKKR